MRQEKSKPILLKLKQMLDTDILTVTPTSKLGGAISHMSKNFRKVMLYIEDGHLPIDNNTCEQSIKSVVMSRKNFLFSDTPRGMKSSQVMYSLVESAKLNKLKVYDYLEYLIDNIQIITPENAVVYLSSNKNIIQMFKAY